MPSHDGGHYFLTVLAPIRVELQTGPVVGYSRSHRQTLAQKLALLATGRQTAASPEDAWTSPLARNTLNHLARFVIVDGPAFNGRLTGDTLVSQIRKENPLTAQPVDRLTSPFLLFAADIDAPGGGEDALRAYTAALWSTMQCDLVQIFSHCEGFEGVADAEAFHRYIKACELDTTMPFNDYWADGLKVGQTKLPTGALVIAAIVAAVAIAGWLLSMVANGLFTLFHAENGLARAASQATAWGVVVVPGLIAVAGLAVFGLYRWIMRAGLRPFPTAPGSDLPSVLKSLFLQQQFTRFAIEAQGLSDEDLHARFGKFLDAVRPAEAQPAQAAGEIRSPTVEWAK